MQTKEKDRIALASSMLAHAAQDFRAIEPLTQLITDFTVDEAYAVQLQCIKEKLEDGYNIVGKKIGLTSLAMQELLGVNQPDYGHLLDIMEGPNRGTLSIEKLFQPKVEAELAFILKQDLKGPSLTIEDVLKATDYVVPAIEIVDSRIKDWKIKLEDTVADNASSGFYVLGDLRFPIEILNLPDVEMELFRNNESMNTGRGSSVLGNPALCVAWLGNKLSEYGSFLRAGEVILSGALSAAISAEKGDVFRAVFTGLETVEISFD